MTNHIRQKKVDELEKETVREKTLLLERFEENQGKTLEAIENVRKINIFLYFSKLLSFLTYLQQKQFNALVNFNNDQICSAF